MEAPGIRDILGAIPASRAELLKRIERWTQGRKISLCRGLCAKIITTSEVVLAHGLAQDEIDRWMEAYKRKDFEALKIGYRRKRRSVRALCRVSDRSGTPKSNLDVAGLGYPQNLCTSEASPQRGHEPAAANSDHITTRRHTSSLQPVRR
jgi:hypothetical protein